MALPAALRMFLSVVAILIAHDVTAQPLAAVERSPVVLDVRHPDDAGLDLDANFESLEQSAEPAQAALAKGRACEGCPPRRLGTAFLQVTYVNIFYGLANLIRGQDTARITPSTWWTNMERGWEWDLDDFVVNQVGHP